MTQGYSTDNYTKWAENLQRKRINPFIFGYVTVRFCPFTPLPDTVPGSESQSSCRHLFQNILEKEQWVKGENGLPFSKTNDPSVENSFMERISIPSKDSIIKVLAIDEGVGKLIKALKDTGQYENTLIVFGAEGMGTKGIP